MARVDALEAAAAGLQRHILGYRLTQAIGVVARLGVADLLVDGPRTAEDLARATRSNPQALYRVLRLLASEDVFAEVIPQRFALTPLSQLLRRDVVGSMRARVIIEATEWSAAWAQLPYSVATGKPAFEQVFGAPPFAYYAEHPEAADLFDATMASMTERVTASLVAACDVSGAQTVVDVGGGRGALLIAILRANPHLHGVLFDRPSAAAGARPALCAGGVADRTTFAAGDFFDAVPAGADAYLMKFILADWDDADAIRLLKTCRRAMHDRARLLVFEMIIPPGNEPFYGKWTDVNMLVMLGGRERTADEYRRLFNAADLEVRRVVETSCEFSIIEGVPRLS